MQDNSDMVLLAFIGGVMVGGTLGVLVAALCFAAWRTDASAQQAAAQRPNVIARPAEAPVTATTTVAAAFTARHGGALEAAEDKSA